MNAPCRPSAPFGRRALTAVAHQELGPYALLTLLDGEGPRPLPGQFYMLMTPERWGGGSEGRPYLPRALSFARATTADGGLELDFLFECVGPGTERLAEVTEGEGVLVTGPFGNGFTVDQDTGSVLVGGGIGLAPVVALREDLGGAGAELLVGMRSAAHAEAAQLLAPGHQLATDDGSAGHHGFVTDLLAERIARDADLTVYACGPSPMLEAVRRLCAEHNVPVQLAMEAAMACGYGACHGCVVPTRDGYKRLCVDGPVIDGAELETALQEWEGAA